MMAKPQPIPEIKISWRCPCGTASFAHRGSCDRCGERRPNEEPKK